MWCGYPSNENPAHDCKHYPKLGGKCTPTSPCCGPGDLLTCEYEDGINKPGKCESQDKVRRGFPIWQGVAG